MQYILQLLKNIQINILLH